MWQAAAPVASASAASASAASGGAGDAPVAFAPAAAPARRPAPRLRPVSPAPHGSRRQAPRHFAALQRQPLHTPPTVMRLVAAPIRLAPAPAPAPRRRAAQRGSTRIDPARIDPSAATRPAPVGLQSESVAAPLPEAVALRPDFEPVSGLWRSPLLTTRPDAGPLAVEESAVSGETAATQATAGTRPLASLSPAAPTVFAPSAGRAPLRPMGGALPTPAPLLVRARATLPPLELALARFRQAVGEEASRAPAPALPTAASRPIGAAGVPDPSPAPLSLPAQQPAPARRATIRRPQTALAQRFPAPSAGGPTLLERVARRDFAGSREEILQSGLLALGEWRTDPVVSHAGGPDVALGKSAGGVAQPAVPRSQPAMPFVTPRPFSPARGQEPTTPLPADAVGVGFWRPSAQAQTRQLRQRARATDRWQPDQPATLARRPQGLRPPRIEGESSPGLRQVAGSPLRLQAARQERGARGALTTARPLPPAAEAEGGGGRAPARSAGPAFTPATAARGAGTVSAAAVGETALFVQARMAARGVQRPVSRLWRGSPPVTDAPMGQSTAPVFYQTGDPLPMAQGVLAAGQEAAPRGLPEGSGPQSGPIVLAATPSDPLPPLPLVPRPARFAPAVGQGEVLVDRLTAQPAPILPRAAEAEALEAPSRPLRAVVQRAVRLDERDPSPIPQEAARPLLERLSRRNRPAGPAEAQVYLLPTPAGLSADTPPPPRARLLQRSHRPGALARSVHGLLHRRQARVALSPASGAWRAAPSVLAALPEAGPLLEVSGWQAGPQAGRADAPLPGPLSDLRAVGGDLPLRRTATPATAIAQTAAPQAAVPQAAVPQVAVPQVVASPVRLLRARPSQASETPGRAAGDTPHAAEVLPAQRERSAAPDAPAGVGRRRRRRASVRPLTEQLLTRDFAGVRRLLLGQPGGGPTGIDEAEGVRRVLPGTPSAETPSAAPSFAGAAFAGTPFAGASAVEAAGPFVRPRRVSPGVGLTTTLLALTRQPTFEGGLPRLVSAQPTGSGVVAKRWAGAEEVWPALVGQGADGPNVELAASGEGRAQAPLVLRRMPSAPESPPDGGGGIARADRLSPAPPLRAGERVISPSPSPAGGPERAAAPSVLPPLRAGERVVGPSPSPAGGAERAADRAISLSPGQVARSVAVQAARLRASGRMEPVSFVWREGLLVDDAGAVELGPRDVAGPAAVGSAGPLGAGGLLTGDDLLPGFASGVQGVAPGQTVVPAHFAPLELALARLLPGRVGSDAARPGAETTGAATAPTLSAASLQPRRDRPARARVQPIQMQPARVAEVVQRLEEGGWRFKRSARPPVASAEVVQRALSGLVEGAGQRIPRRPRTLLERVLQRDFAGVRVQMASLGPLGIEAAAQGNRVFLSRERGRLETPDSLALLGHELTHVAASGAAPLLDPAARPSQPEEAVFAPPLAPSLSRRLSRQLVQMSLAEEEGAAEAVEASVRRGAGAGRPVERPALGPALGGAGRRLGRAGRVSRKYSIDEGSRSVAGLAARQQTIYRFGPVSQSWPVRESGPGGEGAALPSRPGATVDRLEEAGWRFKRSDGEPGGSSVLVQQAADALTARPAGGLPLPERPRTLMERVLQRDFSGVRLQAAGLAPLGVEAATRGQTVYLQRSALSQLERPENLALLSHELTHVAVGANPPVRRSEQMAGGEAAGAAPGLALALPPLGQLQGNVQREEAAARQVEQGLQSLLRQDERVQRDPLAVRAPNGPVRPLGAARFARGGVIRNGGGSGPAGSLPLIQRAPVSGRPLSDVAAPGVDGEFVQAQREEGALLDGVSQDAMPVVQRFLERQSREQSGFLAVDQNRPSMETQGGTGPGPGRASSAVQRSVVQRSVAEDELEEEEDGEEEQEPNWDRLAEKIYPLIKRMLMLERERRPY